MEERINIAPKPEHKRAVDVDREFWSNFNMDDYNKAHNISEDDDPKGTTDEEAAFEEAVQKTNPAIRKYVYPNYREK